MNDLFTLFLAFISSLVLTAILVPAIIRTSYKKGLFDHPSESRKIHTKVVPNLGGVAIFAGFMFCQQLFIHSGQLSAINQVLMCGTILFMVGLKDDIVGLSPYKKFFAQFAAALILAVIGDVRISNLQGFFGFYELSDVFSISLTVFSIVGIVNAFNLIDGLDGLASMLGLIIFSSYGFFFYNAGEPGWAALCLCFAGTLVGFLLYNKSPASIFMGDSGSLFIGFFAAVTTIQLMNTVSSGPIHTPIGDILSANGLAMAALIIPLFDTCRVFILRILDNRSPFEADRSHIHHRLLQAGLSHSKATALLSAITLSFLLMAFFLQDVNTNQVIATLGIIILCLNTGFTLYMNSLLTAEKMAGESLNRMEKTEDPSFSDQVLDKIFDN
jgi:UDP-N-acetylmuramyl pentapeptide phosphotransferase/UDP-N-acetylglucosamine-1-phosphate transferase